MNEISFEKHSSQKRRYIRYVINKDIIRQNQIFKFNKFSAKMM